MKNNYLVQAWLVLMLAVCFGAALAGVETTLKGRIDANKLNDTIGQIPSLVPGAESGASEMIAEEFVYRAMDSEGQPVGWVLPAGGQGFADRIEILIGLDGEATEITGLYVLDQKETPGLGNKIVEDEWRGQFKGKNAAEPIEVVKGQVTNDQQVEAITGATISSDSVVDIVNSALSKFRAALATQ